MSLQSVQASPFTFEDLQKAHNEIIELLNTFQGTMISESPQHYSESVIDAVAKFNPNLRQRLEEEILGDGPLKLLCENPNVTEILVNSYDSIWFEEKGSLRNWNDQFISRQSYYAFIDRLCLEANTQITYEKPFSDFSWRGLRVSLIGDQMTQSQPVISIRRHPLHRWNFELLRAMNWSDDQGIQFMKNLVRERKNILVIGETSSGKTSVLHALMNEMLPNERCIVIEDTFEITPHSSSDVKLLTRESFHSSLPGIDQADLVRRSLRLRPDRIVMGEIRGSEAKDFLMALSTGHAGSLGSLHATDSQQALIRLEMLIQMGAPQWSLNAIRRLIFLSLNVIVHVGRNRDGQRILKSVWEVSSLEENGIILDQVL